MAPHDDAAPFCILPGWCSVQVNLDLPAKERWVKIGAEFK